MMHDKPKTEDYQDQTQIALGEVHQNLLDTIQALLSFFGDLTALTADDQYLAQSHFSD